mgnify:CR=1 FL=1
MTGIDELFREYSEPDEFEYQAQLELFAWARIQHVGHGYLAYIKFGCRCETCRAGARDHMRAWNMKRLGKTSVRAYRCGSCGGVGHSARTCAAEMARAA